MSEQKKERIMTALLSMVSAVLFVLVILPFVK
jgi:hypothetical protein